MTRDRDAGSAAPCDLPAPHGQHGPRSPHEVRRPHPDCSVSLAPPIWDVRVLADEEPQVSPTLAIFFEGCNLQCRFCMAYEHTRTGRASKAETGRSPRCEMPVDRALAVQLQSLFARAAAMQVKTVSLLGGEPSLYLPEIREAWLMAQRDGVPVPPVVLNSNMLLEPEDIASCRNFVSAYVADLKFGNDFCARTLTSRSAETGEHQARALAGRDGAGAAGGNGECGSERSYFRTATAAMKAVASQSQHQLIIRHLPLPGHLECCTKPVLDWIARELPGMQVHLMLGYYPNGRSGIPGIERTLTQGEAAEILELAARLSVNLIPSALSDPRVSNCGSYRDTSGTPQTTRSPASIMIARDGSVLIPDLPRELQFIVDELGPCQTTTRRRFRRLIRHGNRQTLAAQGKTSAQPARVRPKNAGSSKCRLTQ